MLCHAGCYSNTDLLPTAEGHPDRAAALENYVVTWMTEKQYKEAKERRELIWQDVPSYTESRTPEVLDSPSKSGKDLLWDSIQGSLVSRRLFRQSLMSSATLRVNPLQQSQSHSIGHRVASPIASVSPHLTALSESPTPPGFRGFSKWKKQGHEAELMVKIRAKMQEQKKAQAEAAKSSEPSPIIATPQLGAKTLTPAFPSPVQVQVLENNVTSTEAKAPSTFSFTPVPISTMV